MGVSSPIICSSAAFNTSTFADDGRDLAFAHYQVDPVQNRPLVETFGDVLEFDQWRVQQATSAPPKYGEAPLESQAARSI